MWHEIEVIQVEDLDTTFESALNQPLEVLQNYEDWQAETSTIILNIPGIQAKEHHTDEELRSMTLKAFSVVLPTHLPPGQEQKRQQKLAEMECSSSSLMADPWQVYGYRAAVNKFQSWSLCLAHSSTGLNQEERLPANTVFLTDCWSILQCLQSPGADQIVSNIRQELSLLKNKTTVTLQWIPSHCGVWGNEEADRLSKMGSKLEQFAHHMSYREAKTILWNNFRTDWQQLVDIGKEEDRIHQLDRAAQVAIFRLRTEHCQLLAHLHSLEISHSEECPCGTGPQTCNHILQSCPTSSTLRCQTWPSLVDAHRKLLGPVETLRPTVDFALLTGLKI